MKQIILTGIALVLAAPAFAAGGDTNDYRVNGRSYQDPYALPQYDVLSSPKFVRKTTTVSKSKNDTPALTIVNEPYFPSQVGAGNLTHMGQGNLSSPAPQPESLRISDDVPTDLSPPPMKADMVTMAPSDPVKTVDTWRARKGESLYQVLNRWSERSGTPMTWSSMKSPKLGKNISFVGTYQDAVTNAMKASGADDMNSEWNAKPTMVASSSTTTTTTTTDVFEPSATPQPLLADDMMRAPPLTPEPLQVKEVASLDAASPMPLEPIQEPQALPQRARYYALAGTSLEQALRAWAGTQEFSLVWQADRDFQVKQTVSSNHDAELALRDILSMYEGDAERPVGKLYRDPRTSRPVLVIKSDKSRS